MTAPRRFTAGLGLLLSAMAMAVPAARQTATFSSRVDAVRVDVLVTDHGQPVRGLRASDFRVTDNGVEQQVDLAAFDSIPLNVVLALDASRSMVGEPLANLKAAGRSVIDALTREDRGALVTFSQVVTIRQPLTPERALLLAALGPLSAGGETALVDGAQAAMALGESSVGRPLVILFSDGLDTTSWLDPKLVLNSARRGDAVVYAVSSSGAGRTPKFLEDLCETTGGRLLEVQGSDRLTLVLLQILQEFRQRYVISYSPRGVARDGWHALQVKVKGRGLSVKARPGYTGTTQLPSARVPPAACWQVARAHHSTGRWRPFLPVFVDGKLGLALPSRLLLTRE